MKLSLSEAILLGLWARKGATIQQVLILKFVFWSENFPCLSRNRLRPMLEGFICSFFSIKVLISPHQNFQQVNIFHLVLYGCTKQLHNFTNIVFETPSLLYRLNDFTLMSEFTRGTQHLNFFQIQSNPLNTDTEGAIESVRINRVSL